MDRKTSGNDIHTHLKKLQALMIITISRYGKMLQFLNQYISERYLNYTPSLLKKHIRKNIGLHYSPLICQNIHFILL